MKPICFSLALLIAGAVALPAGAQEPPPTPNPARSIADGVYSRKQAALGKKVFQQECSSCHSPAQFKGTVFTRRWTGSTADDLFEFIRTSMPFNAPGGLTRPQYAAVVAHFFDLNGFPAGEQELDSTSEFLRRIQIVEWKGK